MAVVASALATTACAARDANGSPIAITHTTVIDVKSGATQSDMTVIVSGNRIQSVAPASSSTVPPNARIVDGHGKFVIPGLWDMHVHAFVYVFSDFAGPLMIANGVTGARDMGYYIDTTLRWKRDIAKGKVLGPRLVVGVRVDGSENEARFVAHVKTGEDGVRAVDTLARAKDGSTRADFIKTYSWVPRAAYFGIVNESKKIGIPFAGHVPYSISVEEAANSGQRSIEHEDDLMRACTSRDSVLRMQLADTANLSFAKQADLVRAQAKVMRSSYDSRRCGITITALARNGTWVTPTLVVYQPHAHAFDTSATHPALAKYVPGIVQGGWLRRASVAQPGDSLSVRSYFSFERTRELRDAGIRLLAGTDTPQPFVYPGFSLHDELELLVKAGLTPLEALRTATYNPAEYLNALDSLGTVAPGKIADLVVLDANPLERIQNTRRISAVVANGRLFRRPELDSVLADVAATLGSGKSPQR